MKIHLQKVFTNTFISLLAVIFIAIEAVPVLGTNPNPFIFIKVGLWIIGSIFVWFNKNWAAIYLAILAGIYFVVDILLPIPAVISMFNAIPMQAAQDYAYIPHLVILTIVIEIVFLLCFIYYGIYTFRNQRKAK